jgi:glutamine amidotransferase
MIAVIDYGAGNLHSVKNALDFLGAESTVTDDEAKILSADKVILPGVGAFGDAMKNLCARGLDKSVRRAAEKGTPLLGVCLGLHLLFESSEESPEVNGLGIFKGAVRRIPKADKLKIPHIGWNEIIPAKHSRILSGVGEKAYMYFVHSYYICPEDESIVSAYTDYGNRLPIAVEKENVFATQFHPEKSGTAGLEILKSFINL